MSEKDTPKGRPSSPCEAATAAQISRCERYRTSWRLRWNGTYSALLLYPWVSFGLGVSIESSPTWPTSPSVITG